MIAWRNARVAEINANVRRWRYGDNIPTPFMPGERALARAPVTVAGDIALNTNEEARVMEIERDVFRHEIEACDGLPAW